MRWFWQRNELNDVEQEVKDIEKEERKSQKHYNRIANLAIWTIAFGAILSTSGDIIDKLFAFDATPAQIGSLVGYFIAVLVGNSMMFAAAKKILYAIEVNKEWDVTEKISVAVIGLVMVVETISFLTFLWNFERLEFNGDYAFKIFISAGRAIILSCGAIYLELWLSDGISPARIQSLIRKIVGLGTLTDLYRIMRNNEIATSSKVNMYAASLEQYASPTDSLRAIANEAENLVDVHGNRLLIIPKAKDPYMIEGTLASAQRNGTIETGDPIIFASAEKATRTEKAYEKPVKKRAIVTRMSRDKEQKIQEKRVQTIRELLSVDANMTNYAIAQQLKITETQVKRLRTKYEI